MLPHLLRVASSFLLIASSLASFTSALAQKPENVEPIRYTLTFENARNHYVDVEMKLSTYGKDSCELMMATWTPGSYLIREYARHIDQITASSSAGKPLTLRKQTKNRWVVTSTGQKSITVKYRLYCREMSVRTNFVDSEFAILNGAATFVTPADQLGAPHWISVQLPTGWSQSVTALDHRPNAGTGEFVARDFDHLVDSPLLVGNPEVQPFSVGGKQHQLVNLGGSGLWDSKKATQDVAKIVAEHHSLWGSVPYKRYLFLNVISESGGGLEHNESSLLLTSRWSFRSDTSYKRWLGLVSHEFFHVWNVRTMRPKELVKYDYENENYFRSLWIAEGITSYYDDLCLARTKLISEQAYLSLLSKQIDRLQSTPGRLTQSLSDSSYDSWIKYYRSDEHSSNAQISYYVKGAIAGFLLDMKLRELTKNAKSLDDVMRQSYEQFSGDRGYSEDDFRKVASSVAGQDLSEWFQLNIDDAKEMDYSNAIKWIGLQFPTGATKSSKPWTGLRTRDDGGKLIVSNVQRDSPAFETGVNVDDELIAANKFRVSASTLERVLTQIGVGKTATILVSRRGELIELELPLKTKPASSFRLSKMRKPSKEQSANYKLWLKSTR